jgi:hypothetical protein
VSPGTARLRSGAPISDHEVRAPRKDRERQTRHAGAGILPVRVGVHDDVGAKPEAGVQTRLERRGKTTARPVPDHVVGARRRRHLRRPVAAAVVDDDDEDPRNARDFAREVANRFRERRGLVERGNLDGDDHEQRGLCVTRRFFSRKTPAIAL